MKISQFAFPCLVFGITSPVSSFAPPFQQKLSRTSSSISESLISVDASALGVSPDVIIPAAVAAVAAIGAALGLSGKKSDGEKKEANVSISEPEAIDVSIPYDAAASLAYNSYTESSENSKVDFKEFQSLHEKQMVAEVKAKVQERKVAEEKSILEGLEKDAKGIKSEIEGLFAAETVPANDAGN